MRAVATWCVQHRRTVVFSGLAALILISILGITAGSTYSNTFSLPKTQSTDALHLLQAVSPKVSGDVEQVVFGSSHGEKITNPAIEARINAALTKISKINHVTTVVSPLSTAGSAQINKSKTVAFATVKFDQLAQNVSDATANKLVSTAKSADGADLQVAVGGQGAELTNKVSVGGQAIGVLLAGIAFLLVFGSLLAMAWPRISALASLGIATGLIELLSHVMKMPQFASELPILIGLGVGVDYALFIVTRHRQGLIAGHDNEESIVNAVNTSGRAVLFAGIIVCIALLGMFALGVSFLYGLAVAAAIGVALTMVAALTLLPAMLGFIGPKVMSRKQKRNLAENGPRVIGADSKGFWPNWADRVQRYPWLSAGVALVIIVAIALPFFSLQLGSADQGTDPAGTPTRVAFDMLSKGFGPGFTGPLELVTVVPERNDPALEKVVAAVAKQPGVVRSTYPTTQYIPNKTGDGYVALTTVYPTTSPQDAATTDLVNHLRDSTVPQAVGHSGLNVLVAGTTALYIDFANVLSAKLPLFIGLVVILSFLLLMTVFRSLVIPLTAAVMNLLSIGAALGILVAVFQWGDAGSLIGLQGTSPVEAFLPVMLFAILFGLSMDYQVFLVSRMHEEYIKSGGNNRVAVRNGLAATGKTITAAALIMILVFGSFILGGQAVIKEFGIGLAGGVLVDAVLIRMAVVPSLMMLLGKANWWFPKSLDRILPRLSVDADDLATLPAVPVPDPELV